MPSLRARVYGNGWRHRSKSDGALSEVWIGCSQDWFVYDKDAAGDLFPEEVTVLDPDFCCKASEMPPKGIVIIDFPNKNTYL